MKPNAIKSDLLAGKPVVDFTNGRTPKSVIRVA